METGRRSDERRCARRKSEPGCSADAVGEGADENELNRLRREYLGRDGGAIAERAKPVTERTMFGCGWPALGCETRVVIGVVVYRRRRIFVPVVWRVPPAQRARQDEDDRQCDERRRAESQRTYNRTRAGRWRQVLAQAVPRVPKGSTVPRFCSIGVPGLIEPETAAERCLWNYGTVEPLEPCLSGRQRERVPTTG
jgi:hypothetical protein